jgi:archaellum biogenesis ATPase FlaH
VLGLARNLKEFPEATRQLAARPRTIAETAHDASLREDSALRTA